MCRKRKRVVLSPISRQTIINSLINSISTIGNDEEIEISFSYENNTDDNKGFEKLNLELVRKTKLPDNMLKIIKLDNNMVDVNIFTRDNNKSLKQGEYKAT